MQFQLSVFYINYYLSYVITTEDKITFHFKLKSAPASALYAPDSFAVSHNGDVWKFDTDLDEDFKKEVIHTLKKAKL